MEYLYIICLGLLVFFSFSLITKKQKTISEWIFTVWTLLLMVTVFSFFLYVKALSRQYPIFITLICDSHLLHGAILFMYVKAFTTPGFKLKHIHFLHFVPAMVQVVAKLILNYGFGQMSCYMEGGCVEEEDNPYVLATNLYKYLVLGLYILFTWKSVLNYKKTAQTPRDLMRLEWVKQITLGVIFLYFGVLLIHVGRFVFPDLFWERMLLGNTLTTLFILIFLYIGNSYAYMFVSPSRARFKNLSESSGTVDAKTPEQQKEVDEVYLKLKDYMETEKPYAQGHLTLKILSEAIGIPSAAISQSVNTATGSSVTDFINTYRVELLKEKIADPENKNFTIMAMAADCGFTSKSTLIRIFKQHTGQTPSAYLDSVQSK